MSKSPVQKVARLLALVPYFNANPGVLKVEAARDLGISVKQLEQDLNLLWLCGLPGNAGGDLIDLSFTGSTVEVTDSQGMDRPLRLTRNEATTILLALGFLVDQQSSIDPSAARSAMAKIEQAAGSPGTDSKDAADPAGSAPRNGSEPQAAADSSDAVRRAVHDRRALQIRYYSAARDDITERVVDPVRIQLVGGNSYLEAWCRSAEAVRLFRFDRIDTAVVLDEQSAPRDSQRVEALSDFYDAGAGLPQVRLAIAPDRLWARDYFPMVTDAARDDGGVDVTLRYASDEWLVRMITGFGGRIRILDDERLAGLVDRAATAGLDAYAAAADELTDVR